MQYKNYITDFSSRAKKVLEKFSKCDPNNKLNVTVLLSVATSAFVIPFERLKEEHPFGDRRYFEAVASHIDEELGKKTKNSCLFKGSSWGMVTDTGNKELQEHDFNEKLFKKVDNRDVREIISAIRNALAHGNINTKASANEIDRLYFVSKKYKKSLTYNKKIFESIKNEQEFDDDKIDSILRNVQMCKEKQASHKIVVCSVDDFKSFVYEWINLLANSKK